jgi:serine-type D-Ala-D-Ala carboxypeptidase/endopeptidase (penicillin-binding protein 4)
MSLRMPLIICISVLFFLQTGPRTLSENVAQAAQSRRGVNTRPRQTRAATRSRTLAQLKQKIRELLNKPEYAPASIGIHVATLEGEKLVFEQNGEKLLTPASNMKIFTTSALLDRLGPDFRIRTSVYAPSSPDTAGRIKGDLILYGRGDPSLASRFNPDSSFKPYEQLARQLTAAGVKRVEGDLIADESYLRGEPLGQGWEWMDLQWHFGAEISALTTNDNSIEVSIKPGAKPGDPCTVTITPDVGYVSFINRVQTVDSKTPRDIGINRGRGDNSLLLWGQLPVNDTGFLARVAVYRPAGLAAALFRSALTAAGITVTGQIKIADASLRSAAQPTQIEKDKPVELAAIESPSLGELVRIVNKFSHNLYAELLLRVLGKTKGPPEQDSDLAGLEVVKDLLHSAGVDTTLLEITDGSGLSRRSLVTPEATAQLLAYAGHQSYSEVFKNSLPLAGVDGTLTRRMVGTAAAKNVKAKTGALGNTSALSGYITTAAGEELVFSIFINHFTDNFGKALALENSICVLLADYSGKAH